MIVIRPNNTETALLVLQTFLSSVKANTSDYHFFEALPTALREELKPFLYGFQTQAFLHDLHIHFTVDEGNCPMCRQVPIEEYIGLFCVKLSLPEKSNSDFMALVHPYPSFNVQPGEMLGLFSKDIQIIECIDGTVQGNKVILKFFAPILFVTKNYNVTMAIFSMEEGDDRMTTLLSSTVSIKSLQTEFKHYNFSRPTVHDCSSSVNHDLTSNIYTQDSVVSEITLRDSILEGLTLKDLSINRVSYCEIQLVCGAHKSNLKYCFPVNFNEVKMKLSKAQRKVTVICPRETHHFDEDNPILIVCPDHQLSLPRQDVENQVLTSHAGLQLMSGENSVTLKLGPNGLEFLSRMNWDPLNEVKATLLTFFQNKGTRYFHLKSCGEKTVGGQILVGKHVFDYQHCVPALDLVFCFPEDHSYPESVQCIKVGTCENVSISSDQTYQELKKVLYYFAKRTNGDLLSAGVSSAYYDLVQQGVDRYFTRAVVYFLYGDADRSMLTATSGLLDAAVTSPEPESQPKTNCSFCNKSGNLKTCKQCGEARYCNKECQLKHWRRHKAYCKKSVKVNIS